MLAADSNTNSNFTNSSTYKLLDHFIDNQKDGDGSNRSRDLVVNRWNSSIEEYLLEIQQHSNSYYLMLNHMASFLLKLKWVLIGSNLTLSLAVAITTGVVLGIGNSGIWLPIFSSVCLAISAFLLTMFEYFGFSEWVRNAFILRIGGFLTLFQVQDCKDSASKFIKLGRLIEAMKRVERNDREEDGVSFMNKASTKYEKYRSASPTVYGFIYKKYFPEQKSQSIMVPLKLVTIHQELQNTIAGVLNNTTPVSENVEKSQVDHVIIDMQNMDERAQTPQREETSESYTPSKSHTSSSPSAESNGKDKGAYVTGSDSNNSNERSDMKSSMQTSTLDDLFRKELKKNQDRDDIELYENYVRDQGTVRFIPSLGNRKRSNFFTKK